jgi:hypothetical protein
LIRLLGRAGGCAQTNFAMTDSYRYSIRALPMNFKSALLNFLAQFMPFREKL